jgi:mono/diheme cytochrome c family protein/5-hydroxyisourate hydrolase-like protein (transthyretin family)
MKRQSWWLLSLTLSLMGGLWLLLQPEFAQARPPAQAPTTKPSISGGRALWSENCEPCHGPTGQGDGPTAQAIEGPLPDFTDSATARQRPPIEHFDVIKNGRMEKMMPPWGNRLNDSQIWDLTAYVWSLSTTPESLTAGETIYQEQCATCHGASGAGDGAEAPAGIIDLTDLQTLTGRSQADLQAGFAAAEAHDNLDDLPEQELWQALDYVRTFSFAVPQRNGTLTGQVINATTGNPIGDLELTLYTFEGNTPLETLTAQADAEGRYSFKQLPTDHTMIYVVEGRYQDVPYTSDFGVFTPDSNETTLDLKVYETTTDPGQVELGRLNLLMSFSPEALRVIQLFILSNAGEKTYLGQEGESFAFTLPKEATNVTFQHDTGRIKEVENGYTTSDPVLPGEEGLVVAVIYDLPYEGEALDVTIPLPKDVISATILLQDQGASLSSDQLQLIDTREREGVQFGVYTGNNVQQAEGLKLSLAALDNLQFQPSTAPGELPAGATVTPGASFDQNLARWVVIGLVALVIVGAGVFYPRWRPQSAVSLEDSGLRRQKLLLLLARLDDAFESGQLNEQVYWQARARYKAELAEVWESAA